jgi:hypothetical protein
LPTYTHPCTTDLDIADLIFWTIIVLQLYPFTAIISTMAQQKQAKTQKKKVLTKKDRIGKRVNRVHKAIARKKI